MFKRELLPIELSTLRPGCVVSLNQTEKIVYDGFGIDYISDSDLVADSISYCKIFDIDVFRVCAKESITMFSCKDGVLIEILFFKKNEPIFCESPIVWDEWFNDENGLFNSESLNAPNGFIFNGVFENYITVDEYDFYNIKNKTKINLFEREINNGVSEFLMIEHSSKAEDRIQPYFGVKIVNIEIF